MISTMERKELPPQQIERALSGSRKDLDALVRWYGPTVWSAVAARIRNIPALTVQMEDLVGSVWLELCRNDRKRMRYYDPSRGEFGYFVRLQAGQIAWSLVVRELGRAELVQESPPEPSDTGLESRMASRDLLERLALRARDRLSESDWAVFNATYVEGLTSEEVAERLQKKVKTLYQQKHRLREKLEALARELLAEDGLARDSSEPLVPGLVVAFLLHGLAIAEPRLAPQGPHSGVEVREPTPLEGSVR